MNKARDLEQNEEVTALIDFEMLGKMISHTFQVENFIPFNVSLEIMSMNQVDDGLFEFNLKAIKENVH